MVNIPNLKCTSDSDNDNKEIIYNGIQEYEYENGYENDINTQSDQNMIMTLKIR